MFYNLGTKKLIASFKIKSYFLGAVVSLSKTVPLSSAMFNSFFFLILCRTVVENSKSVRRNTRRSTFFQRKFKVLTFLRSE